MKVTVDYTVDVILYLSMKVNDGIIAFNNRAYFCQIVVKLSERRFVVLRSIDQIYSLVGISHRQRNKNKIEKMLKLIVACFVLVSLSSACIR